MNRLAMILGATLLVAGSAAMYLRQELRAQRELNAAATVHVTTLESAHSQVSTVVQPVIDGARAATMNPATAAQAALVPAAPEARNQAAGAKDNPQRALVEQMLNSPAGREMQRTMMRQMLEEKFPQLAKDLNLSEETAGKLLDLLAKQQMDEVAGLIGEQGGGKLDRAAREEQARNRAEGERAIEAEMKTLLGDSHAKWGEYANAAAERQREGYARVARDNMRNAITAGGAPLTDAQFEYLNSAVTAEQKRIDQESGAMTMQQQMQRLPENNRRLAEAAAAHLSPQQLEQYRRYLQQQQEMLNSMEAMGALLDD